MSFLTNNYNRKKIAFKKGKGSFLYSTKGKKYLDFVQGMVNFVIIAISKSFKYQLKNFDQCIYYSRREKLAKKLLKIHFFCNVSKYGRNTEVQLNC